jgi:hypothetical protein
MIRWSNRDHVGAGLAIEDQAMNFDEILGLTFAALFAAMFGSILLYLIDLFRLGQMLRTGKILGFDEQLKPIFPVETPIQPAFRALMRFMRSPDNLGLKPEDAQVFRNCKRMLIVCAIVFSVTFSMAIIISAM